MNFFTIIDAFSHYGLDVFALAMATAFTTQIIKVIFFKKANKKIVTFLPFVIGTLYYAAFAALKNMSFEYIAENYIATLEKGFSVGAVATLIYVLYEQFVREKSKLSATQGVIKTLIEGYVPTDKCEEVAKLIAEAIERDVTGDGAKRAEEILKENVEGEVRERDIALLAKLIIETLAHITTS